MNPQHSRQSISRRELCKASAKVVAGAALLGSTIGSDAGARAAPAKEKSRKRRRCSVKLVITVVDIEGRCPAYKVGDKIVLDNGYKFNLQETTAACMHSLASILPYHVAIAKGVPPNQMGLAHKSEHDGKAYVHCLDPCEFTGGGTTTFSIERVEQEV